MEALIPLLVFVLILVASSGSGRYEPPRCHHRDPVVMPRRERREPRTAEEARLDAEVDAKVDEAFARVVMWQAEEARRAAGRET